MSLNTPLHVVNKKFGDKSKLVDKVLAVLTNDSGEDDDAFKKRIGNASNKQLIRLLERSEELKGYGGKEKLVGLIVKTQGRTKDADYVKKLGTLGMGKLLDQARAIKKAEANAKVTKEGRAKIKLARKAAADSAKSRKDANRKAVAKRIAQNRASKKKA